MASLLFTFILFTISQLRFKTTHISFRSMIFFSTALNFEKPNTICIISSNTWVCRFDNYGKQGLLCGSDGLPHLIVSGDQRHWGEFITPGILFLYIAGWIGWVGRSYLIAIRDEKKPTQKEIIIDVPLASRLVFRGFIWPVAAYREYLNGDLIDPSV